MNLAFLKRLLANPGNFPFVLIFTRWWLTPTITNQNMYSTRFVVRRTKLENDADNFIEAIISTTYENLTAEYPANNYTFNGMHPTKDVNGLVRARYDILVDHMKTAYGIDLQAIGDTVVN